MTSESDVPTKCYRIAPGTRILFTLATVAFFLLGVITAYVIYVDHPDKSFRLARASGLGGFWFLMMLLSLYVTVDYYRYRLWLYPFHICQRGLRWEHILKLEDISELRWNVFPPPGILCLRVGHHSQLFAFGNFTAWERLELINYFRTAVHPAYQIDREQFDAWYFPDPTVVQARRRMLRRSAMLLLITGFAYLLAWFFVPWARFVVAAVGHLLIGGILWVASRSDSSPVVLASLVNPAEPSAS